MKLTLKKMTLLGLANVLKVLFPYNHSDRPGSVRAITIAAVASIVPKLSPTRYVLSTRDQRMPLISRMYSQIHVTIFPLMTKLLHTAI